MDSLRSDKIELDWGSSQVLEMLKNEKLTFETARESLWRELLVDQPPLKKLWITPALIYLLLNF